MNIFFVQNEYEVIEKRTQIEREVHEIEANPKLLLNELVHQVCIVSCITHDYHISHLLHSSEHLHSECCVFAL